MAINLNVNGTDYPYPEEEDFDWGVPATQWASAVTSGMLQKAGGAFTLLADVNFGPTYGLVSTYYKSRSSNIADAGALRLSNTDLIDWRNNANGGNLALGVSTSDRLQFGGVNVPTISSTDTFTNKTLTSPVINSPTGIVKGDVGLGNVDNTSDATKNAAVATLTNKSIVVNSTTFVDNSDNTKQLLISLSGHATGAELTLISNAQDDESIILPTTSTTLVGDDTTNTLTNKTVTNLIANGTLTGTAIKDEDNMSSDSATAVPTQQSVKAYVDTSVAGVTASSESPADRLNYNLNASAAAGALTITLKDGDGNDPSAGSPVVLSFRSTTLTSGVYTRLSRASALSVTIPSTATMGWSNGDTRYVYVYGLNNSGAFDDLVVSSQMLDENALHTTTTIDTGADSLTGKYSNTGRTSMPVRYLGKVRVVITTAGTWVAPDELSISRIPNSSTAMDNAEATKRGLKLYIAGTNYNNGISPTLSGTNSWSTVRGVFRPFQTQDGTWFLWMQVQGTVSSASRSSSTVDINGITTKNVASYNQALACTSGGSATDSPSAEISENDNTVVMRHATDTTSRYSFEGTIELESKPTWAYG
jgi:hypothetical protein